MEHLVVQMMDRRTRSIAYLCGLRVEVLSAVAQLLVSLLVSGATPHPEQGTR